MLNQQRLPPYDHLVIIGNGFDLNLGLPTSYGDFIKSPEFNEVLRNKPNLLFNQLESVNSLQNWIDVENQLKTIARRYTIPQREHLKTDFKTLKDTLSKYLSNTLSSPDIETTSKAYKFMDGLDFNDMVIINFNYTNVLSMFMNDKKIEHADKRIIHIHGDYKENNLILGVEDGTKLREGHEFLLKSLHANYIGFNLMRLLKGVRKLTIFGHSLGQTDNMYFTEFFEHCSQEVLPHFEFDLYYYDDNSFDSLMARINTLTEGKVGKFRQNLKFTPISSM